MLRSGSFAGLWLAAALAVAAPVAEPRPVLRVSGTVVDLQRPDDDELLVVIATGEEDEVTLMVGPDTRVSVAGEDVPREELEDALGAEATARYRETGSGLLLEAIDLTWPEGAE